MHACETLDVRREPRRLSKSLPETCDELPDPWLMRLGLDHETRVPERSGGDVQMYRKQAFRDPDDRIDVFRLSSEVSSFQVTKVYVTGPL